MAYPVPAPRPTRPASVVVGVVFVLLAIVAHFVLAVSQFLIISPVGRAVEAATVDRQDEGFGTFLAAVLFGGGGGLNALVAVTLSVLVGFVAAGKQAARIMTWIVAPLGALCCGCASAIYSEWLFRAAGAGDATGQDLSPEQTVAIADGMPAWYTPAVLGTVALLWIAVLGTIIALAMPTANQYFRKPAQLWLPYQPDQPYPPQWPPPPGPPIMPPQ